LLLLKFFSIIFDYLEIKWQTRELKDGRWGCFEIKLSEDKVPEAIQTLLSFKEKIIENEKMKVRPPSFLAVLVGRTSYMRTTPEGVHVIPITSLTA